MAWPSIAAPTRIKSKYFKKQNRSTMETGKIVSGAAWESGAWVFTLEWDTMSAADVSSLVSAYESDLGDSFSWTHNVSTTSYTVGYSKNPINIDTHPNKIGYYIVSVELEQQ